MRCHSSGKKYCQLSFVKLQENGLYTHVTYELGFHFLVLQSFQFQPLYALAHRLLPTSWNLLCSQAACTNTRLLVRVFWAWPCKCVLVITPYFCLCQLSRAYCRNMWHVLLVFLMVHVSRWLEGARSNDSKQFGWRAVLSVGFGKRVLRAFCFASSHLLRTREAIFI